MKKKISIAVLLLAVICAVFVPMASADTMVSVVAPATVSQGTSFVVDVAINGVTDLYGLQLDLNFDPAILSASSVAEGSFLSNTGSTFFIPGTVDNTGGSVTSNADTLLSAVPGVSGSGNLFQFSFLASAPGSSNLDLANILLVDSTGNLISYTFADAQITVTPQSITTPEPGTLALLLAAVTVSLLYGAFKRA